jgi:hypothetical protein
MPLSYLEKGRSVAYLDFIPAMNEQVKTIGNILKKKTI